MRPIDRLPQIGERVLVRNSTTGAVNAGTIINMADCKELAPDLFRRKGSRDPLPTGKRDVEPYQDDEPIRAWRYDAPVDGWAASCCIMRFGIDPFHYNHNVYFPDDA
jgi:hypothetical protein